MKYESVWDGSDSIERVSGRDEIGSLIAGIIEMYTFSKSVFTFSERDEGAHAIPSLLGIEVRGISEMEWVVMWVMGVGRDRGGKLLY